MVDPDPPLLPKHAFDDTKDGKKPPPPMSSGHRRQGRDSWGSKKRRDLAAFIGPSFSLVHWNGMRPRDPIYAASATYHTIRDLGNAASFTREMRKRRRGLFAAVNVGLLYSAKLAPPPSHSRRHGPESTCQRTYSANGNFRQHASRIWAATLRSQSSRAPPLISARMSRFYCVFVQCKPSTPRGCRAPHFSCRHGAGRARSAAQHVRDESWYSIPAYTAHELSGREGAGAGGGPEAPLLLKVTASFPGFAMPDSDVACAMTSVRGVMYSCEAPWDGTPDPVVDIPNPQLLQPELCARSHDLVCPTQSEDIAPEPFGLQKRLAPARNGLFRAGAWIWVASPAHARPIGLQAILMAWQAIPPTRSQPKNQSGLCSLHTMESPGTELYLGHQLSHIFDIWEILVITMKNDEGDSYSTCKPVGLCGFTDRHCF
ncbi:hypothetical protein B0H11DRAFT_2187896 [Mycena galericulata]|nr:hypothetical protein B0H11DRAFT_2187896 [Mycena galericulata]